MWIIVDNLVIIWVKGDICMYFSVKKALLKYFEELKKWTHCSGSKQKAKNCDNNIKNVTIWIL